MKNFDEAASYISGKKYQAALPVMEKCYKENPENPITASYYGVCLAFASPPKFELAEKLCIEAIKKEIYNSKLYSNLALVYYRWGKRYEAIITLENALKWDPNNKEALALRKKLKIRREPVFSFLPRDNILNIIFGKIRHKLLGPLE